MSRVSCLSPWARQNFAAPSKIELCLIGKKEKRKLAFIDYVVKAKRNVHTDKNSHYIVVFVVLLFYIHGKHLRSCWDGQLI